ncbi:MULTISPECIES: single-stranded DNA-binding protein [Clostridium]|uniref:Single-stranded DNA-binding protein n=1 Tax=Clostridium carnis TaxID=1530 RepID=A0ABY6SSW9_9CLOT|nr:single-stranded DNA-binding protein [Clostridium carnis]CAI3542935.1 Single-stranded DNA-binding protein [Clostridium neonatale]CAI3561080.1 Single-stranded DNA-binding protein [Clostridium neonatale]CAI3562425.1 Single-stranded DNA-binding protein [Clostridium neonatale]CAI3583360.1 Single-stranded DNA-binding protein [Clostridium neonatale]CAI3623081.1 Single-stranded DNA-binding protein [Clostridium neonatale]
MNKVVLIGRLTKDPELRFIQGTGTAVTTLTLAVDRYNTKTGQKEADFIPIVIWGKQSENVANYLTKGSQAAISGRIQTRNYEAKDGNKRYITEVVADVLGGVQFIGGKNDINQDVQGCNNFGDINQENYENVNFEEDIPVTREPDMPF